MKMWKQIETMILRHIEQNSLDENAKLPPDREFARMAKCSIQPVIRAMHELARKGLICRLRGGSTTVLSCPPVADDQAFSFSHRARHTYDLQLKTEVLDFTLRLPNPGEDFRHEVRAQQVLGLRRKEAFWVIMRKRILNGEPRVLHCSYLNPNHFPDDFKAKHDFATESLIEAINSYGFRIEARNTTLRARFPTKQEAAHLQIDRKPVLEVEQELEASHRTTNALITIEYLKAVYLRWDYKVADRRPAKKTMHV